MLPAAADADRIMVRLTLEIAAATLLIVCISATSAAFATDWISGAVGGNGAFGLS